MLMKMARTWDDDDSAAPLPQGRFRLGSSEHLTVLSRMLLDSHDPYRPALIE
jgi:hypothetical protein